MTQSSSPWRWAPLTRVVLSPQSSLYREEGLGVTALSTLYGGVLLSSMFLPPLLIKKFGCKWTIVVSMCCYVAFSLGNFYASWYGPHSSRPASGSCLRLSCSGAHGWTRPMTPCSHFKMSAIP